MNNPRRRRGVWIYKITEPFVYNTDVIGYEFNSEWLTIDKNGVMVVWASEDKNYAWDGCTPKFSIFDQFVIGTFDGYKNYKMKLPITGRASLIHDALYQYLDTIPFAKVHADKIFRDELIASGFWLWPVYYFMVRVFGGLGIKQKGLINETI